MASVRASVMNQARTAASILGRGSDQVDARDCAAVDRLVRCAELSEDAQRTLEWAADTLRAHPSNHTDQLACELLTAARDRLDGQPATATGHAPKGRSLAWL